MNLNAELIEYLSNRLNSQIHSVEPVIGGDICNTYKIKATTGNYIIKHKEKGVKLFQAEEKGLLTITQTKTINAAHSIGVFHLEDHAFLVLEYIPTVSKHPTAQAQLGKQLAKMHLAPTDGYFGFEANNFIGSLQQNNNKHDNWVTFYIEERLCPQMNLAKQNGYMAPDEIPSKKLMNIILQKLMGSIQPSLLHGDLWGGNYLIKPNGSPVLIDPAVHYGHSEVDLAMTKLFGGFTQEFYIAYHKYIPAHKNQAQLTDLYQLYYLLVHLNLFGFGYKGQVNRILKKYFF